MTRQVNSKAFACIFLIMLATYSAEILLYDTGENFDKLYDTQEERLTPNEVPSFEEFMDIHFLIVKDEYEDNLQYNYKSYFKEKDLFWSETYSEIIVLYKDWKDKFITGFKNIFEEYSSGSEFYRDMTPLLSQKFRNQYNDFLRYHGYQLSITGGLQNYEQNIIERALGFLSWVWKAIEVIGRIITFTLPNTPPMFTVIMNIIFGCLWFYILLNITDFLTQMMTRIRDLFRI